MALKDHEIAELVNEVTQYLRMKLRNPPSHLREVVSHATVRSLGNMNAREDHKGTSFFLCRDHDGVGFKADCRVCREA